MFTGTPQKNLAVARHYFEEHLSYNDYYARDEIKPGQWIGSGIERLGMYEGAALSREDFFALCENRRPSTGETVTQRRNVEDNRRVYYDFTCSAPKSVSIMAVTMRDQRIIEAHQEAARLALRELERFGGTRVRTGGQSRDRITGNVVGAEFLHNSSRALDPQLHTHFVLFNCTFDPEEKHWKALQTASMFQAIQYGTEVYRNELARRLMHLGYEIEKSEYGFKIRGVPERVISKFSKRAAERDKAVAELEQKLGRKLSNNEVSHVIHQTRARKLKGVSTEEVQQYQMDQLSVLEKWALSSVLRGADGVKKELKRSVGEKEAFNYAKEHVFERESVVSEHKLLHAALVHGRGQVDLDSLKAALKHDIELVHVDGELSTRGILKTELWLIESVNRGKGSANPISTYLPSSESDLGPDQRYAVSFVLSSSDCVTGIRGLAGTGKSRTLSALCRILKTNNHEPLLCAPTGSAADNLRRDKLDAITLQRLLADQRLQSKLHQKSVLIIDEAGMVGIDEMKRIFQLAQEKGTRVVLCGDTGQHGSVTRGDALRILETHSRYSFAELTHIRRQKPPKYLAAVKKASARQPQKAFELLDEMKAIIESSSIYEHAARAYCRAVEQHRTVLLVSPTWREIHALTDHVRRELKQAGRVGPDEKIFNIYDSLSWTNAQKRDSGSYESGQMIVFHQANGPFSAHESARVLGTDKNSLHLQRQNGTETVFDLNQPQTFDVCQEREMPVAPGDKLLLQASHRSKKQKLVNGEIVQIQEVKGTEIKLADGRTIPANYRTFTHGYAVTSYAAQSKTVDSVYVVASSGSLPAINRRQFYVDVSRGREECRIYTDNKELLQRKIVDPNDRKAAIELSGLAADLNRAGYKAQTSIIDKGDVPRNSIFRSLKRLANMRLSPSLQIRQLRQIFAAWTFQFSVEQASGDVPSLRQRKLTDQQQSHNKGVTI